MRPFSFILLLLAALNSGCAGSYTMMEENIENGMVVGEEKVSIGSDGRIENIRQKGYFPGNPYLDAYKYDGENLGPNAPGYIP